MGDGKTSIKCLEGCEEEIDWKELEKAVGKEKLAKMLRRRQAEEVAATGLNNLVSCPFCPWL